MKTFHIHTAQYVSIHEIYPMFENIEDAEKLKELIERSTVRLDLALICWDRFVNVLNKANLTIPKEFSSIGMGDIFILL
jgi:hypothetical protein